MNHTGPAARVGVTPTPAGSNVDRAAAPELAPNTCSPPPAGSPVATTKSSGATEMEPVPSDRPGIPRPGSELSQPSRSRTPRSGSSAVKNAGTRHILRVEAGVSADQRADRTSVRGLLP